ncbi:hypothetical protein [Mesorhizobium sp. DCY119]|uniref:hypothetical protein n=1 Tax=Mesorhizobium sp. DCY119 TaxID=2108445 RepID=UPI0010591C7E|nr:hypothetical protein [Mesorhizobium sp. DCY119]
MEKVDLGTLTKGGRIRNLSGKERGVAARTELGIDQLDQAPGTVEVVVPDYVDAISPSYFQGLFSQSIAHLNGKEGFLSKYHFAASDQAMQWVNIGIRNATTSRAPLI